MKRKKNKKSDREKVSIRMDGELLAEVRRLADQQGHDFSHVIREAVRSYIETPVPIDSDQSARLSRVAQYHSLPVRKMLRLCLDFSLEVFEGRSPMLLSAGPENQPDIDIHPDPHELRLNMDSTPREPEEKS